MTRDQLRDAALALATLTVTGAWWWLLTRYPT